MLKVYLAGPIRGLNFDQSTDWRDYVSDRLKPEILPFSPLRGKKKLLSNFPVIDDRTHPVDHPLTTPIGIVVRDHNDVYTCDSLFVNLLFAETVSQGTVSEIAWAYAYRKPIVVVIEGGNVHQHSFLTGQAGFIVNSLDLAIEITRSILLP